MRIIKIADLVKQYGQEGTMAKIISEDRGHEYYHRVFCLGLPTRKHGVERFMFGHHRWSPVGTDKLEAEGMYRWKPEATTLTLEEA